MNKECKVWTIKDNYRLGDDIQSKVLAFAFGLSAEIERNLISQRTKEALARKKVEGIRIGRIKGSHNSYTKLSGKEEYIMLKLAQGIPKVEISRELGIDRYTFPFLLCLSLLFFSQLFVRPPQTTILPFLHFFFLGMVLIIPSCTML